MSPYKPLPMASVPGWDQEVDVAVVGFGAAGACAAIEARDVGATVALFERNSGSGGASAFSGGEIYIGGSGGSDAQRDAGFTDATEDLATYLKLAGGARADEAKCDLYAAESMSHYAWLKAQGVPYRGNYLPGKFVAPADDSTLMWSGSEAAAPFCDLARPAPRGHVVQHDGSKGGRFLVDVLEKRIQELGVEVVTDARVTALIVDGSRVVGLVGRVGGEDRFVRARRGVVLATGGFAMNLEMRRKYCPDTLDLPHPIGDKDDGIGIELGVGAGADTIHMDQYFATCPWIIPEKHAYGVFVNKTGQRFINEDCYHGRVSMAALAQPERRVYLLLDMAHFDRPLPVTRMDIVATGDSWEEVEAELHMASDTLSHTMRIYNEFAREGRDPLFDKRPPILVPLDSGPFVALELDAVNGYFPFFTLGGMRTSVDGEVLDRSGSVIPGLFAAGRCAAGLPAWGAGYSSGMSLADSTYFGRRAGRRAAADA